MVAPGFFASLIHRNSVFCGAMEGELTEERPLVGQLPCLFYMSLTFIINLINNNNFLMVTSNSRSIGVERDNCRINWIFPDMD